MIILPWLQCMDYPNSEVLIVYSCKQFLLGESHLFVSITGLYSDHYLRLPKVAMKSCMQ